MPFFALYSKLEYKNVISQDWLAWFIGFAEGDGAILSYNGRPSFVLTQKESAILYHIQSVLGFGTVCQTGNYYRYFVVDLKGVILLCLLFNRNLVLQHRINPLEKWINNINNSLSNTNSRYYNFTTTIVHNIIPFVPTLTDPWISGFTDAEGTFNVNIKVRAASATGYQVTIRFLLDQKNAFNELMFIRNLFGYGQVKVRAETSGVFRYSNDSFIGLQSVSHYFTSFPLKTKKGASFDKWYTIYNMLLKKEHLTPEGLEYIRSHYKLINKFTSESSATVR